MNNSINQAASLIQKILVVLAVIFITSCSSNKAKDDADAVEEPTVQTTPIDQAQEADTENVDPAPELEGNLQGLEVEGTPVLLEEEKLRGGALRPEPPRSAGRGYVRGLYPGIAVQRGADAAPAGARCR